MKERLMFVEYIDYNNEYECGRFFAVLRNFCTNFCFLRMPWPPHTVAIWTFIFHKISGFVRVILKANFKQFYRPKVSIFWSENSDLLFSFSFYFLQNLSNPLLFAHCCCYSKELTCLNCVLMQKSQFENDKSEFSDQKIDTFGL